MWSAVLILIVQYCLQIKWENRKIDDIGNDALASVDGVDCQRLGKINHDGRPDKRYYSHKFKGPALRYEVAIAIRSSNIVWIAGPYLPGECNDLQIFRKGLIKKLGKSERVEADDGYIGEAPKKVKCPGSYVSRNDQKKMRGRLRMRHESINERLKNFNCLSTKFRHSDKKHGWCFRAVAVATQLAMELGEEIFDVREYHDNMSDDQVARLYKL